MYHVDMGAHMRIHTINIMHKNVLCGVCPSGRKVFGVSKLTINPELLRCVMVLNLFWYNGSIGNSTNEKLEIHLAHSGHWRRQWLACTSRGDCPAAWAPSYHYSTGYRKSPCLFKRSPWNPYTCVSLWPKRPCPAAQVWSGSWFSYLACLS